DVHVGASSAVTPVKDGAIVLVGGFGMAGMPVTLIEALIEAGPDRSDHRQQQRGQRRDRTGGAPQAGRVTKVTCSFPRQVDSHVFDRLFRAGEVELELFPQGSLAERMRAAGAGIGAFYMPTGAGTLLAEGKETS
ncbi:MAG: 3-oxoacid CoA-transferase subunit A, partial [Pseudonocardiaceae bacterium]